MALDKATREQMTREALAQARELLASIDLTVDEMQDMSLDELVAYLSSHGVDLDLDLMEQQARAQLGGALVHLDRGQGLDKAAQDDLEQRVQRAMATVAETTARQTMRDVTMNAMHDADERPWDEQQYMWVSVGEGVCPSCYELHGDVLAWDQWLDHGLPGSAGTICTTHCRCHLVPVALTRDEGGGRRQEDARTDLPPRRG